MECKYAKQIQNFQLLLIEKILNLIYLTVETYVRLRIHKFPIKYGRRINFNLEDRKCKLCDSNDLGDEFHYLFKCKFFDESREDNVDKICLKNANILKLKSLMDILKKSKLKYAT